MRILCPGPIEMGGRSRSSSSSTAGSSRLKEALFLRYGAVEELVSKVVYYSLGLAIHTCSDLIHLEAAQEIR